MSKNNKEKKNDNPGLQNAYDAQKRELVEKQFTIKKLQHNLDSITIQNKDLTEQFEEYRNSTSQKIDFLEMQIKQDTQRLQTQINKITELEINSARYITQISHLKDQIQLEKQQRNKQLTQIRIKTNSERLRFEQQLKDVETFLQEKRKYSKEITDLKKAIQQEKGEKLKQLSKMERNKIQQFETFKSNMNTRVKEMKNSLLSLKQQQLTTTTRLTLLQNQQLTSQLQFQAKQTERIITKQEELMRQVRKLTQQVEIHKTVESQLAKRAQFSKEVIKKMNSKILTLEQESKKSFYEQSNVKSKKSSYHGSQKTIKNKMLLNNQFEVPSNVNVETLIVELEKKLEETQKKYLKIQSKYYAQLKEKQSIANRLNKIDHTNNKLVKMLMKYSEDIFDNQLQEINKNASLDNSLNLNLDHLRNSTIEEWSSEEINFITKLLINLIRPYLTRKNILIPEIKKILCLEDSSNIRNSLPKIASEHREAKKQFKSMPMELTAKIVASNIREWGKTVHNQGSKQNKKKMISLKRKVKLSFSER